MAETLLSPGVLLRENDSSQVTTGTVTAGLALVGPTVKGRQNIPTLVTSYSDYKSKFGDSFTSASNQYEFLTSIAAYNYFQQGGQSILVTRITSQSYSSAEASAPNLMTTTAGVFATGSTVSNWNASTPTSLNDSNVEIKVVVGADIYRFISVDVTNGTIPDDDIDGKVYFYEWGTSGNGNVAGQTAYNFIAKHNAILGASGANIITAAYNGVSTKIDFTSLVSGTGGNGVQYVTGNVDPYYNSNYAIIGYTLAAGAYAWLVSGQTGGGTNGLTATAFTLETISEGVEMNNVGSIQTNGGLALGTKDNIRWEVSGRDLSAGTFNLLVRQGDDTTTNKTVLETWTGLSLDPNSTNYISRVIGDMKKSVSYDSSTGKYYLSEVGSYRNASRYVRVKTVSYPTPNYFNNDGSVNTTYANYLPVNGSGSAAGAFSGATGNDLSLPVNLFENIGTQTQGVGASNYTIALNLLNNTDEYDYQLITTPGLLQTVHSSPISTVISNTEARGDSFYILDTVGYGATTGLVTTTATALNTNYAATYWPWLQTLSPATGKLVWVPASTLMAGVYAFNDRVAAEWFAPAGMNRGGIGGAVQAERKLSTSDRDTLYTYKVNPIGTFPGVGLVAYGQKTLQTQASALDRVNVRRLLINLKRYVKSVSESLLFEQNTIATRNNFISQVNPYLESVQQKQGLYAYKVVMDDSNNTSDTIDRNQLVGAIYIQPAKTIEYIYIDFNITPTGVTFGS